MSKVTKSRKNTAKRIRDRLRTRYLFHVTKGDKAPKLKRAYQRWKTHVVRLNRAYERQHDPRKRALAYSKTLLGLSEKPPGSNRGGKITDMQLEIGKAFVGSPWCGTFLLHILRKVGVKFANPARVAYVPYIVQDAKAGVNGFKEWKVRSAGNPGDLISLFGQRHVALVIKKVKGGYITREGNTSSGITGSQSNGGGSYERFRPFSDVDGVAVPDYASAY
ncbi:hypothetical protein [Sinimarinibacterium flocculans]|mgnify:CR=1 FL=1|uniref:hypothetical protein n=1 Tax=Sinimarinibacterium flocculans TaxID=985250 RepID=UPI002491AEB1|nr:hypothetical protein [Sinimarinibacterium flocculans]